MPPTLESPAAPPPALADFDSTFGADLEAPAPPPATVPDPTQEPAKPEPTPEPAKTTQPKDPETGKFTTKQPEPPKAPEKPQPEPAKPVNEFEPPQVAKPNELRNYARKMAGRAQQAEQSISQLRAEINQLKANPQQSVDAKALTEELASAKKQLQEAHENLRVVDYSRHPEYVEKYEKPYQETVQKAYRKVAQLVVRQPKPGSELDERGNPTEFTERAGTSHDLDAVYYLNGDPVAQSRKAKELFGENAERAINLCEAIADKREEAVKALEESKKRLPQIEQQTAAQKKLIEEGRNRMFTEALQGISQKHPDLFDVKDGDTEWNTALEKGRGMADLAFGDRSQLTPAQSTILDAHIFSRVSSYPAVLNAYRKSAAKIAALEKEVTELRGSSPGKPSPSAPKPETGDEKLSMEQAFDKFVP